MAEVAVLGVIDYYDFVERPVQVVQVFVDHRQFLVKRAVFFAQHLLHVRPDLEAVYYRVHVLLGAGGPDHEIVVVDKLFEEALHARTNLDVRVDVVLVEVCLELGGVSRQRELQLDREVIRELEERVHQRLVQIDDEKELGVRVVWQKFDVLWRTLLLLWRLCLLLFLRKYVYRLRALVSRYLVGNYPAVLVVRGVELRAACLTTHMEWKFKRCIQATFIFIFNSH